MTGQSTTNRLYDWIVDECSLNDGILGYRSMIWLDRWRMWLAWRNLSYWSMIWLDRWRMRLEWRNFRLLNLRLLINYMTGLLTNVTWMTESWATDQWSIIWLDRWRLWRLWLNLRLVINYMTGSLTTVTYMTQSWATDQLYNGRVDDCRLYDWIVDECSLNDGISGYWSMIWLDTWRMCLELRTLRLLINDMTGALTNVTWMTES